VASQIHKKMFAGLTGRGRQRRHTPSATLPPR